MDLSSDWSNAVVLSYHVPGALLCFITLTHDHLENSLHRLNFNHFLRLDKKPIEVDDQKFHIHRQLCASL